MKIDIRNKRILIIGSSRGIGFEIAKNLYNKDAKILLSSSNKKNINLAYKKILESNILKNKKLYKFKIDISNINTLNNELKKIKLIFKKIDVIIICAAVLGPSGKLIENNLNDWQDTFNTNLFGPVRVIQNFLKANIFSPNSKIIFLSGGISSPDPYFTSFNASKHALNGFANSLSSQLFKNKIWINSVLPGSYHTKMNELKIQRGPKQIGKDNYKIAISRINQNIEKKYKKLNNLIEFLCSNYSNGITGRIISAQYDNWKNKIEIMKNNENELYKIIRKK